MKRGLQGRLVQQGPRQEVFKSLIPKPLPPNPPIEFGAQVLDLMEKADLALGRLDGLARLLPDLQLFLHFYLRKEAVLSSQIEGTQSSLFRTTSVREQPTYRCPNTGCGGGIQLRVCSPIRPEAPTARLADLDSFDEGDSRGPAGQGQGKRQKAGRISR